MFLVGLAGYGHLSYLFTVNIRPPLRGPSTSAITPVYKGRPREDAKVLMFAKPELSNSSPNSNREGTKAPRIPIRESRERQYRYLQISEKVTDLIL